MVRTPSGTVQSMTARYVIVADGANSFVRPHARHVPHRRWPFAAAIRWSGRRRSPTGSSRDRDPAPTDRSGQALPGYGWVAPVGDGTVNIGVGLLEHGPRLQGHQRLAPARRSCGRARRAVADRPRRSDGRRARRPGADGWSGAADGRAHLPGRGRRTGVANPFTGSVIDDSYETGRMAADVIHACAAERRSDRG